MVLDELLEGIELFPLDRQEPIYLTGQEAIDYDQNRHKRVESGIENEYQQLQILMPRIEKMLELFDESVLKGYSGEKDSQYEAELSGTCIPCFASLPKDYPPFIKLTWALLHVGESRSMSLVEICGEAITLRQEDLERFAYRLRRNFVNGIDNLQKNYDYHKENPLGEIPQNLKDPDIDDESSDWWLELREEKERIGGKMTALRLLYQTMVELIKRKTPS